MSTGKQLPTFRSIVVPSYLCTTCNTNTKIQSQSSNGVASMAITAQKVHIRRHVADSCTAQDNYKETHWMALNLVLEQFLNSQNNLKHIRQSISTDVYVSWEVGLETNAKTSMHDIQTRLHNEGQDHNTDLKTA